MSLSIQRQPGFSAGPWVSTLLMLCSVAGPATADIAAPWATDGESTEPVVRHHAAVGSRVYRLDLSWPAPGAPVEASARLRRWSMVTPKICMTRRS